METCKLLLDPFSLLDSTITILFLRIAYYIHSLMYLYYPVLLIFHILISSLPPFFIISILLIIARKRETISFKKIYLFSLVIAMVFVLTTTVSCYFIEKQEADKLERRRFEVEQIGYKIAKSISSRIIYEELINDPHSNNKYKLLRINVVITVPEAGTYTIQTDLRDTTGRGFAVTAYINGKNYTYRGVDENLIGGENTVTFDFPYSYYNDYQKTEAINLPFNDTPNGNYGPYKFTLSLVPANSSDFMKKAEIANANGNSAVYNSRPYQTIKVYKYSDFYR